MNKGLRNTALLCTGTIAAAAALSGCSQNAASNVRQYALEEYQDITPHRNGDGNYNVIFITTDQERYFSEYPEGTNFLARQLLSELGVTFEKNYTCSNMSTSSRSVIYTGTHITDTLMYDNTDCPWQQALHEDVVTVADRLQESGYYTALKGKWHMNKTSIMEENDSSINHSSELEKYGFADWNTIGEMAGGAWDGYNYDMPIASDSIQWLRSTGMDCNANGQSFFLAVNFVNPHDIMLFNSDLPGETKQAAGDLLLDIKEAPPHLVYADTYPDAPVASTWDESLDTIGQIAAHAEYLKGWNKNVGTVPANAANWERFRDYYYNCIKNNDNQLLLLINELRELDLLSNTIIIYTSDHGEMLGAHGLRGKGGNVYEENIHVPLVIYTPETKGGQSVNSVTSLLDITPTILDAAQTEAADLPGHSLLPLVAGSAAGVRDGALFAYGQISMLDGDIAYQDGQATIDFSKRGFVRGIITDKYKFARYFSPLDYNNPTTLEELLAHNDLELYDLTVDPEEVNNLAAEPEANAELIMQLNEQLNALIAEEIGSDDGSYMQAFIKKLTDSKSVINSAEK